MEMLRWEETSPFSSNGPDMHDRGKHIHQHYFRTLVRVENSYELTKHRKGITSNSLGNGDSLLEIIRAFMLYVVLAHQESNHQTLTWWLLGQPDCPHRCRSTGDAHPFTALFDGGWHTLNSDKYP